MTNLDESIILLENTLGKNGTIVVGNILGVKVKAYKKTNDQDFLKNTILKNTISKISPDVISRITSLKKELLDNIDKYKKYKLTNDIIESGMKKPDDIFVGKYGENLKLSISFKFNNGYTLLLYINYDAETLKYKDRKFEFGW